jgi:hypothetical protein
MRGQHNAWRHWQRYVVSLMAVLVVAFSMVDAGYAQAAQHPISTPEHTAHLDRPADTYNCTTTSDSYGHCYGEVTWTNCGGPCNGVQTQPIVEYVTCNSSCTSSNEWFVTREQWLADTSSWAASQCTGLASCWVEAGWYQGCIGQSTGGPACSLSSTSYFWADNRPCSGGFYAHVGGAINSDIGSNVPILIYTAGGSAHSCSSNGKWNVEIWGNGGVARMLGTSTWNPMQPYWWQLGVEVYGNTGQSAVLNDFQYNSFWPQGGSWQYTTSDATVTNVAPANAYWNWPPSRSRTGGDLRTSCGC